MRRSRYTKNKITYRNISAATNHRSPSSKLDRVMYRHEDRAEQSLGHVDKGQPQRN